MEVAGKGLSKKWQFSLYMKEHGGAGHWESLRESGGVLCV